MIDDATSKKRDADDNAEAEPAPKRTNTDAAIVSDDSKTNTTTASIVLDVSNNLFYKRLYKEWKAVDARAEF